VFFKEYLFVLLDVVTGEIRANYMEQGSKEKRGAKFKKA
jgi:hypothetical protein